MKTQHANSPMPMVAMVGLCFGLLAFAFTLVASVSGVLSFGVALLGFATSIGATMLFGGILLAWVRS